jgi:hypothetical protein
MERSSVCELVTLYEFEPNLFDVYVEGIADVRVVRGLLAEYGIRDVVVKEIETVDVPLDKLRSNGFTPPSRRGEVITLAKILDGQVSQASRRLACIADLDLDETLGRRHSCSILLYTDFSCMESYVFDQVTLSKLLRFCGYRPEEHYETILESFCGILRERHCQRVANERLGFGLKKIELRKFLSRNGGCVKFDAEEYVSRVLNKSARSDQAEVFRAAVESAHRDTGAEPRCYAHGHDLMELLEWLLHEHKCVSGKAVEDTVAVALYCAMEFRKLGEVGMFKELLARISSRTEILEESSEQPPDEEPPDR